MAAVGCGRWKILVVEKLHGRHLQCDGWRRRPPFYSLSTLQTNCPNAVVVGFGVNVGTFNPNYDVYADLVDFNGTTYDFEPYLVASNKDQCKSGGYNVVKRADGISFKNQGDCIQYVNTGK